MHAMRKLAGSALAVVSLSAPFVADAQSLGAAGEGRRLYLRLNCYSCHGNAGQGGMGPRIAGEGDSLADVLREGAGAGMRSYSGYVTATDVGNLATYLRSIGTVGEPKFTHWWESVPSK